LTMRVSMARFPFQKTLDAFDFKFQPSIDQSESRRLGRGLRRPGHCLRHPRSPAAPLDHRQHPGRQLPAQGEDESGTTKSRRRRPRRPPSNHQGGLSPDKWGHVT
jgi:hypothetical protein